MTDLSAARRELDDLADELSGAGVSAGMLFGRHALKTASRKVVCFEYVGAVVFKLPPDRHAEILALEGASIFTPRAERPAMGNWLVVPEAHAARWPTLARSALAYVSG